MSLLVADFIQGVGISFDVGHFLTGVVTCGPYCNAQGSCLLYHYTFLTKWNAVGALRLLSETAVAMSTLVLIFFIILFVPIAQFFFHLGNRSSHACYYAV